MRKETTRMSDATGLKLGQNVPDFELATYDPVKDDFGKFSLADQIARKRWTILFFYPADFTFV
jgi:peroxiredoxin (alkyl hydroperoxide reductase subunit C)